MRKVSKILPQKTPFFIPFILTIYFNSILLFGILRLVLIKYSSYEGIHLLDLTTLEAFLIGIQFDSVILAYILTIPLILLFLQSIFHIQKKAIVRFVTYYLTVTIPLLFFITIADIPYFRFFNNRISEASLQWLNSPDIVFEMIYSNPETLIFLCLALAMVIATSIIVYKYCSKSLLQINWESIHAKSNKLAASIFFVFGAALCFLGMRGTIKHPIRQDDAFYCSNPCLNQVGLNPCFTLMKSYLTKVSLMNPSLAIKNTQEILKINTPVSAVSPIAREVKSEKEAKNYNVVLILMESMSADYMTTFGNQNQLTPTLDSLSKVSWFFKNAFSSGIHTNNGIFSTLYSFPSLKRIRPMGAIPFNTYSGLPFTLKKQGYKNLFFSTHGKEFDNLAAFLPSNFIDELYTQENYPPEKVIGPFGVPDGFLFDFALSKIDQIDSNQPFFATILTVSNHPPYKIPAEYNSKHQTLEFTAVSYADWCIHNFLTKAKKTAWFDNTIFVIVADHGKNITQSPYDLALSYNHIPLIFYAPKILSDYKTFDNYIGQIDIFPTLMGIMNISYTNNTLGINALEEKRECIYFSADDKLGCINDNWLYIYRYGGKDGLYDYKTGNTQNLSNTYKTEFELLKKHALSQTQAADWIISNEKTSLVPQK